MASHLPVQKELGVNDLSLVRRSQLNIPCRRAYARSPKSGDQSGKKSVPKNVRGTSI